MPTILLTSKPWALAFLTLVAATACAIPGRTLAAPAAGEQAPGSPAGGAGERRASSAGGDEPGQRRSPTRRINVSAAQTSHEWVSELLRKRWRHHDTGDWLDREGTPQGAEPHGTIQLTPLSHGRWETVRGPGMVALVNRLVRDNTGIHLGQVQNFTSPQIDSQREANPPVLKVITSSGTYSPPLVFAKSRDNNKGLRSPGFLKFDMSVVEGVVQEAELGVFVANVYVLPRPLTLTINYLDTPFVDELPFVETPYNAADIQDIEFTSRSAVFATMTSGNSETWTYNPEFRVDPEYGLPYLRAGFVTSNMRSVRWVTDLVPPRQSVYVSFMHRFETGMWDGQHESGLKLSSVGGKNWYFALWTTLNGYDKVTRDEANPRLWGLTHYMHENGRPQQVGPSWVILEADRWYHFEMHVRMNTPAASDGSATVWVNGHEVFQRNDLRWEPDGQPAVQGIQWQLYQGGVGSLPYVDHWVQVAQFRAGSKRLGVPKRLLVVPKRHVSDSPPATARSRPRPRRLGNGRRARPGEGRALVFYVASGPRRRPPNHYIQRSWEQLLTMT